MAADEKKKIIRNLPRKPTRFPVDLPTTFRLKDKEKDWHMGTLVNLSTGGFCLQTGTELKRGQLLEFLFDTTDKGRRKHRRIVVAKVVWKRLNRYGLQFARSAGKIGLF